MKEKLKYILIFLFFVISGAGAIICAIMCIQNDRMTEGIIIVVFTALLLILAAITVTLATTTDEEKQMLDAKDILYQADCIYKKDDGGMKKCNLCICTGGVLLDAKELAYKLHRYDHVSDLRYEKNFLYVHIAGSSYTFTCKQPLKMKAAYDALFKLTKKNPSGS